MKKQTKKQPMKVQRVSVVRPQVRRLSMPRRSALKRVSIGLATFLGLLNCEDGSGQMSESELAEARGRMKRARQEEVKEVELLYSTKPIRVSLGSREYLIPANYFGPKGKNDPDTFDAKNNGFGFFLFMPDYGGYTKENWLERFDRRLIAVFDVSMVDKNAIIPILGGGQQKIDPAGYGEPRARFANGRALLEEKPSFRLYGLEGYRSKGRGPGVTWVGARSNAEFFFFDSSLAPGEELRPGIENPICQTRYYSEQEDLSVSYRYFQEHIAKWREIDDAIWTKLHGWRVK